MQRQWCCTNGGFLAGGLWDVGCPSTEVLGGQESTHNGPRRRQFEIRKAAVPNTAF